MFPRAVLLGSLLLAVTLAAGCGDDDGNGGDVLAPGEYGIVISADVTVEELAPGATLRPSAQGARAGTLEGSGRMTLVEGGSFTLGDLGFDLQVEVEGDHVTILNLTQDPERESTGEMTDDGTTMNLALVASEPDSGETFVLNQTLRLEGDDPLRGAGQEQTLRGPGATATSEGAGGGWVFDPVREEWGVQIVGPEFLPTATPETVLGQPLASFVEALGVPASGVGNFRIEVDPLTGEVTIYSIEGTRAGLTLAHLDLTQSFGARLEVPQQAAASLGQAFPCDQVLVTCTSATFPSGDVLLVGGVVNGPIPLDDQERGYLYSAALQDEDSSNDFAFNEPYNWDFFQDMDFFVERIWTPEQGWRNVVSNVVENARQPIDVNTWSVIFPAGERTLYAFLISENDLGQFYPDRTFQGFRVTTFGSDPILSAEPEASGGDVSGVDPTEPPLPLPEDRITLVPAGEATPQSTAEAPEETGEAP